MRRMQDRQKISIHALREEGDADKVSSDVAEIIFLSTPSARRATYLVAMEGETDSKFLSTPSARRATVLEIMTLILKTYF